MINQTSSTSSTTSKNNTFGIRLKSAREALGIDRKEAALQLRLQEKMIDMIETGEYKTDIPMTFIRGYIRSYSKMLGIPDNETHEAIELLKPKPQEIEIEKQTPTPAYVSAKGPMSAEDQFMPNHIRSIFKPLFTFLLVITLIALTGIWWSSHTLTPSDLAKQNKIAMLPAAEATQPAAATTQTVSGSFSLIEYISTHKNVQHLLYLIIFLLVIKASMRLYAAPVMAGMRNKPHPDLKKLAKFTLKSTVIITAIFGIGAAVTWVYMQTNHKKVIAPVAKKTIIVVPEEKDQPLDLSPLVGDLVQPATYNALFLSSFRPYFLQNMSLQLDDYISQADISYFELTDKSTPIGAFEGYKKKRRHRRAPNYYQNSSDGNENSNPPPYYYQY